MTSVPMTRTLMSHLKALPGLLSLIQGSHRDGRDGRGCPTGRARGGRCPGQSSGAHELPLKDTKLGSGGGDKIWWGKSLSHQGASSFTMI